ncbi:MAG: NADH-quinone oxidoreductase subunit J, partial [Nitriliruptorales bacterium]|nr:NADH-quinone oxidoreductase subunit J [Nitriliruptorales bacterium]
MTALTALPLLAQATGEGVDAAATSGTAEFFVFWIVAPISLGAALAVIMMRNAVHAALMLVLNFFTIAVLYAVLEAQFLAVVQIIVYAGAIMVLFLFVLMLLGIDRELPFTDRIRGQKAGALLLGVTLLVALTVVAAGPYLGPESACTGAPAEAQGAAEACAGLAAANEAGNVAGVGGLLFTDYVWPFEVTSALLVIAAIGAMVLGRKTEDERDLVDAPRQRRRVAVGGDAA